MTIHLHLLSFNGSTSKSNGGSPVEGSERSSKLIINNEMSSTSERMGAVNDEKIIEICDLALSARPCHLTSRQ